MENFKQKRIKFNQYLKNNPIKLSRGTINYTCPCCGFPTLNGRQGYEICILCWWEDDGQDDKDADEILGGPNGYLSLSEARNNYKKYLDHRGEQSDNPYKEVSNQLIELYYQLLDSDNSEKDIIEKIDHCFKEHHAILSKRIRKYEERILRERKK